MNKIKIINAHAEVSRAERTPTGMGGREQGAHFSQPPMYLNCMGYAVLDEDLDTAVEFACHAAITNKIIIFFNGGAGGIEVGPSLVEPHGQTRGTT